MRSSTLRVTALLAVALCFAGSAVLRFTADDQADWPDLPQEAPELVSEAQASPVETQNDAASLETPQPSAPDARAQMEARENAGDFATAETAETAAASAPSLPGAEAETALMSTLRAREAELTARETALDAREAELTAAAETIERRIAELEAAAAELEQLVVTVDEAAENDVEHLTQTYARMKPKQAGPIFDQMDPSFAAGFLSRMRPDAAGAIMAEMSPERAHAVTLELAGRNIIQIPN